MARAERYPDATQLRVYGVAGTTVAGGGRPMVSLRFVLATPGAGRKRGWELSLTAPGRGTGRQAVYLAYRNFSFPSSYLGAPRGLTRPRDGYSAYAFWVPWRGALEPFAPTIDSPGRVPPPDDLMLLEMHLLPAAMAALNEVVAGRALPPG